MNQRLYLSREELVQSYYNEFLDMFLSRLYEGKDLTSEITKFKEKIKDEQIFLQVEELNIALAVTIYCTSSHKRRLVYLHRNKETGCFDSVGGNTYTGNNPVVKKLFR